MFDIGWGELLLIGIVALIAIGPKELPGALRTLGHWLTKIRRMASEFQGQFQEAMREAELADLKKEVDDMTSQASNIGSFDPLGDVRKEVEATKRDIESSFTSLPTADEPPAVASTVTPTSSYGGPDAPGATGAVPVSAAGAQPSAEPPAVSAAGSLDTATAAPTSAAPAAEPPPSADTSSSEATAIASKPDTGRAA
jgi:sec-independent protein translocase protein TatB